MSKHYVDRNSFSCDCLKRSKSEGRLANGKFWAHWLLRRRATIQCQRAISRSYLALKSAPNYRRENAVDSLRRRSPGTYFPFAKASRGARKMRGGRSDEDTTGTVTGGTGHSRKVRRIESCFTAERIGVREGMRRNTRGKGSTRRTRGRRWEKTTCINDMMDGGRGLCLRYLHRNARKREGAQGECAYPFDAHATSCFQKRHHLRNKMI